jgi:N-acylneuraminate cytidylyltransferase
MPEETALEIDEPEDFVIIQSLLYERLRKLKRECISNIKMVVMDIDGCLTDGGMYYSENGDELKKFNTKDGMAISMLNEKGIITGIITGENRELNRRRAEKLHMHFIKQGVKDKAFCLRQICKEYSIDLEKVLYIGDDINDIEAIKIVGYSACPADADIHVKKIADYISTKKGGEALVRNVISYFFMI